MENRLADLNFTINARNLCISRIFSYYTYTASAQIFRDAVPPLVEKKKSPPAHERGHSIRIYIRFRELLGSLSS